MYLDVWNFFSRKHLRNNTILITFQFGQYMWTRLKHPSKSSTFNKILLGRLIVN